MHRLAVCQWRWPARMAALYCCCWWWCRCWWWWSWLCSNSITITAKKLLKKEKEEKEWSLLSPRSTQWDALFWINHRVWKEANTVWLTTCLHCILPAITAAETVAREYCGNRKTMFTVNQLHWHSLFINYNTEIPKLALEQCKTAATLSYTRPLY